MTRPRPLPRPLALLALPILAAACSSGDSSGESPNQADAMADETPTPLIIEATAEAVEAAFAGLGKTVVTFSGYSGAGYEDEAGLSSRARSLLAEYDPASTLINSGATIDGIGAVYEMAAEMGFETTGVVSSQALEAEATFSPFVDRVYVVADEQWGGLLEGSDRLSPTSEAMVAVSDVILAIGGGEVTRDELVAAEERGKEVRFFPAELEHARALQRAEARGEPAPTDFRGAVDAVFGDRASGEG